MPGGGGGGQRRPRRPRAHRRPAALLTTGPAPGPAPDPSPGPGAAPAIGIDLGGTKCLGVLVDAAGAVVGEHRVATPAGPDAVLSALAEVVETLASGAPGRATPAVASVGVGAPGLVDTGGVLRFAPNLPGVTDLPVRAALEERFPGVHVSVDNDATCAAWAERQLGAARGADDAVLATLGTGIGGGVVAGGTLQRGSHGFAGEIGHMVVDPNGPACPCGRRGCWERFASGSGLGRLGREAAHAHAARRVVELAGGDPEQVRGEHVTRAAAEGDEEARAVMAAFAWWVGLGLANLANVFDPEVLVLGGGLVAAGDVLLSPVRTAFASMVEGAQHRPPVGVVPAELGERAGAIGGALVARDRA